MPKVTPRVIIRLIDLWLILAFVCMRRDLKLIDGPVLLIYRLSKVYTAEVIHHEIIHVVIVIILHYRGLAVLIIGQFLITDKLLLTLRMLLSFLSAYVLVGRLLKTGRCRSGELCGILGDLRLRNVQLFLEIH